MTSILLTKRNATHRLCYETECNSYMSIIQHKIIMSLFLKINQVLLFLILLFQYSELSAQCSISPVTNLVSNGDFSLGNQGFTSGYTYCNASNCLYPEGYYAVGTNANFFHGAFTGIDHTTGTGNFMVVNGAGALNTVIWSQNITVKPNVGFEHGYIKSSSITV